MTGRAHRIGTLWVGVSAVLLALAACGPKEPVRIGFLGGLTERASGFSEDARNGVMLGVEQRNQAGGVEGHRIELVVQDHGEGVAQVPAAFQALRDARVVAVIGPYSSAVGIQVMPLANDARLLMLSPNVAANALAGQDDYMVRIGRTVRQAAQSYAQMLHQRGHTRMALARDMGNAVFSTTWSEDFRAAFAALGGSVVIQADFGADPSTSYEDVVRTMLAAQPDGLLFIGPATDVARLAQQAAKLAAALPMAAVDWAANASLIELGGTAVEGMLFMQTHKRDDDSPRYAALVSAYEARFGRTPTASSIAAYDAISVLADALARSMARGRADESPKDAVLRYGPYEGLQQTIRFDTFGDTERAAYPTVVRNGRFERLP